MTLLRTFRAHKGGLIRLKGELYWREGGWDGSLGRVCLVLDAAPSRPSGYAATTSRALAAAPVCVVLLLIEGAPHWVWVAREDVEIL